MATDDPAGGPDSGKTPHSDASPRKDTAQQGEALREAGGRARRRPPTTIELAAKDMTPPETATADKSETASDAGRPEADGVRTDETVADAGPAETSAATPPTPPPAPKRSLGLVAGLLIALISGLIGGAIAVMVALSLFRPADNVDALNDLETHMLDLRQRTDALEARPQGVGSAAVTALGQRLDALNTMLDGVRDKVSALESAPPPAAPAAAPAAPSPELNARLDALEALAKQANTEASSAAARPAASPDALAALADKITALEQRVEAVSTASESAAKRAAQLGALAALREAVLRGSPFATELAAARNLLGPQSDVLQPLDAYAEAGFPTGAVLLARLKSAEAAGAAEAAPAPTKAEAPATDSAAPAPADEGLLARLQRSAQGLVSVRRVEESEPASTATEATYDRVAAALRRDDMAGAAREIEALPESARKAAQPVLDDIAARAKALSDIETLNRQILAQLAGSAP